MNKLYKRAFNRLPERFRKANNENLYYVLYHDGFDDIYTGLESVRDSRNIDKASGKSLDLLGANVGQFRNGEDDDFYRLLIKTRIIANLSIGDAQLLTRSYQFSLRIFLLILLRLGPMKGISMSLLQ